MNFKKFITEMPQLIPALDHSVVAELEKKCRDALTSKSAEIAEHLDDDVDLYHSGSVGGGLYFLVEGETITYAVEYKKIEQSEKILPKKYGVRQVLISKIGSTTVYSAGISSKVFWDHLFTKFECLISDNQQTEDGKGFWEYQIKTAIEKHLTVRIMNTNDQTYTDVTTKKQFSERVGTTWGTTRWFQRMIIAIF